MKEVLKEAYEHPRIAVRRIVLEGSLAAQSPVKTVTLEAWDSVAEGDVTPAEVSFQIW
jgi:hypothetical protein